MTTARIEAEVIGTPQLDLLPLLVEHAEEMARVLADPALHAFTGGRPDSPEAMRARCERLVAGSPDPAVTWLNWVIRHRGEGSLTGTVQVTVSSAGAEVAWVVGTSWQGRGIATEATQGLVAWLERRAVAVRAHIHPGHRASAAVAAAAGLTPTSDWHDGEIRWSKAR